MFGRFKGMFGRVKDEALSYVVAKDEGEGRDGPNPSFKEETKDEDQTMKHYFAESSEPPKPINEAQTPFEMELAESDMLDAFL